MIKFAGVFFLCVATAVSGMKFDDGFDLIEKRGKSALELISKIRNKKHLISDKEKQDILDDVVKLIDLSNKLTAPEVSAPNSDLDIDNFSMFESAVSVLLYDVYDLFKLVDDKKMINQLDAAVENLK